MRLLRRALSLSGGDLWLLLEAAVELIRAKAALLLFSFSTIAGRIGTPRMETAQENTLELRSACKRVRWSLDAICRRFPLKSACFVRALAAQRMLMRRGLSTTFYFGVRRGDDSLMAHAWLRCGTVIITGEDTMGQFAPVCSYAAVVKKSS